VFLFKVQQLLICLIVLLRLMMMKMLLWPLMMMLLMLLLLALPKLILLNWFFIVLLLMQIIRQPISIQGDRQRFGGRRRALLLLQPICGLTFPPDSSPPFTPWAPLCGC